MKKMLLSFIGIFVSFAICLLMSTKFKSYAATYGGLSLIMISGENAYCVDSCSTNYSGLVEIPSVYNGLPVTHIRDNAFSGCNSIETIIVGNNIKIIGKNAFKYCSSLNLIKMGELVQTIGENAFDGCSSLSMVSITNMENWCKIDFLTPNSNPLYYGADLFFNGKKLSDVVFPSGLTLISKYAFYNSNLTSVNIPSTVTCIQESAFYNSDMLSVVQFNDGVTKIENFAFYDCNSLESLQFSDGLISIGERAFYNCDSLLSFHLPDNLTYIGNAAFYDCDMIESIVFPDVEINIGSEAFFSCSSLSHIIIPDSVKNIGVDVFYDSAYYNSSVNWENKVLYINNYLIDSRVDISGKYYVKEGTRCIIGYAFKDCEKLTSIIIPDSVIELGKASFSCCNNLTSVLLSENISCIRENTFSECNSLKTISIPRKTICVGVSAFENCNSLENISLVDGLTSIGDLAFNNCIALKEIVIPDTVKKIGSSAFKNCAMLESVRLGKQLESIESSAFFDCSVMMSISIPDSVNQVGSNAFANCKKLETLEIGTGVSWFGVDAFINCTSLKNVYIKDLAKWCEMEFEGGAMKTTMTTNPICRAQKLYVNNELVEELVIPNGVTEILHYTFFYCPGIKSLVIPDSVKCVGAYAFFGCNYLKSVSIGDGVENIKPFAFTNCSALYSIEIGRNVKRIENSAFVGTSYYKNVGNWENNTSVLYIGDYLIDTRVANNVKFISGEYTIKKGTKCIADLAFYECKKLTGIIIPDSVTNIGDRAFYDCTSLTSVIIPDSVTGIGMLAFYNTGYYNNSSNWKNDVLYIGNHLIEANMSLLGDYAIVEGTKCIASYAFSNCSSLTNITIPNSVKSICSSAFWYCKSLTTLTIGNGLTSIGEKAFYPYSVLSALKYVFYTGSSDDWNNINISSDNTLLTSAKIHYNTTEHSYNIATKLPISADDDGIIENICHVCGYVNRSEKLVYINDHITTVKTKNAVVDTTSKTLILDMSACKDINEAIIEMDGYTLSPTPNSDFGYFGTGSKVQVNDLTGTQVAEYTLVVRGDVNGDSVCDALDCMLIELARNNNTNLESIYFSAGDLAENGVIDEDDFNAIVNKSLA